MLLGEETDEKSSASFVGTSSQPVDCLVLPRRRPIWFPTATRA
jgi:hypothetical protein